MYRLVAGLDKPAMPLNGNKLSDAQIATIKNWINQGAHWDSDTTITTKATDASTWANLQNVQLLPNAREYWAFKLPAQAPLPVTASDVKAMLGRLRGAKLLKGYRGGRPVDMDKLADVVAKIADAAYALGPKLESLEINPLFVGDGVVEALDGLTIWAD